MSPARPRILRENRCPPCAGIGTHHAAEYAAYGANFLYVVAALTKEEYQKRIDDLQEENADTNVLSNLKHSAHPTEL